MTFTVAGFRLDRPLGQGSQGEVWLAERSATGEQVALKRIELTGPMALELAEREAALLSSLDHPNLIALREFRMAEDAVVLVLELAEAGSLADLLRRRARLTPSEVVAALSPIASALTHAHQADVIHGDVSAANILFTAAGHPKLADLGLARLISRAGDERLGTPAYLDPAIAAGGPAGAGSDVFSLAAVALHCLTGVGPWYDPGAEHPDADEVIARAATGRIANLEARLAAVPPELGRLLRRGLAVDPGRRGTAAEFALDLRAALAPTPVVLAGGRITAPIGRHAAERRAPSEPDKPASGVRSTTGPVRDPGSGQLNYIPADLTRVTRPLIRPVGGDAADRESAGTGGRWRAARALRSGPGARVRSLAVLACCGLLVAAGVVSWPLWHEHGASAATPAPPTPGASGAPARSALSTLVNLDRLRAQAFAERNPDLLGQVYPDGPLLAADRASIARTVPLGCRLPGLVTDYRDLRVVKATATRIEVTVTASLPAATLACPERPATATSPLPATRLDVQLVDDGAGFRIAAQSRAG